MAETYKSGEKVKYRLAEAMKECMKKAPVEKITVKEITEECGVTRHPLKESQLITFQNFRPCIRNQFT